MSTIVMTGGTSGFGADTVQLLRRAGLEPLVASRGPDCRFPVDLRSLDSVREFADRLPNTSIDALILNAGRIGRDVTGRTADGYETTFAVNHLASYLLARLLERRLADGARVILTTSGAHDPATRAGLAVPRHADADLLAHPDRDPGRDTHSRRAAEHAYTASKLCVILTARSLVHRADIRDRNIRVVAFDPGQVFGTGLARNLPRLRRVVWHTLGTRAGGPLRRLMPTVNTRTSAAQALTALTVGNVEPPAGRCYAALRRGHLTWPEPSMLARNTDVARRNWNASAELVGLSP